MHNTTNFVVFIKSLYPISDADLEATLSYFKPIVLKKGDFFVKEGEVCGKAAYINTGMLRTFYINEKGEDITYCFCTENNFTSSFKSFISQQPSKLSIQALEDTELLEIEYDRLQYLYANYSAWQAIGRICVEKEFLVMEQYASCLNSFTAKEKYMQLLNDQPSIVQKAPVQHIASYLGVSRETLSRIRNQVTQ